MANVLEIDPTTLVELAAKELADKKLVQPPVWSAYVKTGMHTERPPIRTDWWYVRAAAVLRSVYRLGPIGTNKLRTKYGGRKNRGYKPEHSYRGSGSIIRKVLQQLEKSGLLAQVEKGDHKGRKLTKKGKSFLEHLATTIAKEGPKQFQHKIKLVNVKVEAAPVADTVPVSPEGEKVKKGK